MTVARVMGMLVALMLLLVGWDDAAAASTAQEEANGGLWSMGIGAVIEGTVDGHIFGAHFTVITEEGDYIGECTLPFVEHPVPSHNCRVDVPSDRVSLVWEDLDSIPAGYAPIENPIAFDPTTYETGPHNIGAFFRNVPTEGSTDNNTSGTSDVAIVTTENGQPAYDACYIFVGYGNEGCDENGDGKITFEDIPLGTWTVRQTADLGPGRYVADFTVQVTGAASPDGWERFPATVVTSGTPSSGPSGSGSSSSGSVDIALITRDPETGGLLTGTCYVLVGYSNEGCDENRDGQVTFAAIPFGAYTVHQTQSPAGYPTINDYEIRVEPIQAVESTEMVGYPLSFVVKQAPEQNAPNTRNVSVVLIDARTNERVQDDFCLEIVGASIEGCDTDLPDGQIDFLDVPTGGPYEINFTRIPPGYNVDLTFDGGPWLVIVNDGPEYPANKMAFVFVSSPASAGGAADSDGGTSSKSDSQGSSTAGLEWRGMVIGCSDPVACYGAEIVVTRDGAPVDSCTITTDPNDLSHVHACAVDVPVGVTIQLHLDESTLASGYVAEENDVSFETTYVGKRASHDFVFDVVPGDGATGAAGMSGSSSGTGNLTVQFWSPRDNMPETSGDCVELVGATKALCSEDYPDGQIEIVDIPAGTYEVCVTHGAPHFFWGRSHGPKSVTITPGSHETIQLDVYAKWNINAGRQCGFD